jgi:hypothetical protein
MAEDKSATEFEGFIDTGTDLDSVIEPQPVPTGSYHLSIAGAKAIKQETPEGQSFLGRIQVRLDFPDIDNAQTLFHNIYLPKPGDEKKKADFKISMLKKFCKLFDIPLGQTGVNTTDFEGHYANDVNVELTMTQPQDGTTGRPINVIKL